VLHRRNATSCSRLVTSCKAAPRARDHAKFNTAIAHTLAPSLVPTVCVCCAATYLAEAARAATGDSGGECERCSGRRVLSPCQSGGDERVVRRHPARGSCFPSPPCPRGRRVPGTPRCLLHGTDRGSCPQGVRRVARPGTEAARHASRRVRPRCSLCTV